jgi:HEAT repeat protein
VRVPSRRDPSVAWEAVVVAGGHPVFVGRTGFVAGQEGERSGTIVEVREAEGVKHVLVGELHEDRHICGQTMTILAPKGLDPTTLALRGATVQRLPQKQRDSAQRVVASPHGGPADPPLARLLVANGGSTAGDSLSKLTDGDPATAWSEDRPGAGQGEFVTMSAPEEVPIQRLSVVVAPPGQGAPALPGAAPKTFFLVTDREVFSVTMPEDAWMHAGHAYDVMFAPEPLRTSCLSVVLDQAYDHGQAHPQVTLAEFTAYSLFDSSSATLDAVAGVLTGGGARAEAAMGVLERSGPKGYLAIASVYDRLDAAGRALAMRVAAAASSCAESAPLLIRGLVDADREVRRKARTKLENPVCGHAAVPALEQALGDVKVRADAAELLAKLEPSQALEPLAKVLGGEGDAKARAAVRGAFALAAGRAPKDAVAKLLADTQRPADARLELVRASAAELGAVREAADNAIDDLLRGSAPLRTRYLLGEPLSTLARVGDNRASQHLVALVRSDPEGPVRAHAAELAAGVPAVEEVILEAVRDPEPRVREAALRAAASARLARSAAGGRDALAHDPWTFVRVAAAGALATVPASAEVDSALGEAVGDHSPHVRAAAISALAERGAVAARKPIRERLEDSREDLDVRLSAAHALGALCEARAVDRLTELARAGAGPIVDEGGSQLSTAAIEALGMIHPPDLATRLAPLQGKGVSELAHDAATRALAAVPHCRASGPAAPRR